MQVDHVAIWVNDLEKMRKFYLQYFDCKSNEKYTNIQKQFSSYFLSFGLGSRIELMHKPRLASRSQMEALGLAHISIRVAKKHEVDEITVVLFNDAYTVISFPRLTGDGYYESAVLDPEKNLLEIIFRDSDSTNLAFYMI